MVGTFLIAGGAGFIGSNLADKLLSLGHQVVVLDNFCTGKIENLPKHKNLKIVKKDICDNLNDVFLGARFDAIFHLAALPRVQESISKPIGTHHTNVNGTLNLLEMCRKYKVKRFVFASSCSVYGDQEILPYNETMCPNPISPYALHKLIGEQYCKLYYDIYGIETVSLRYFNVFGPKQDPSGGYACLIPKFIDLINKGVSPTINGNGEQTRDFVFVEDVADATILAGKTENNACFGEVFNVGTEKNISVNNVLKELLKISGVQIQPIYGPPVIEPKNAQACLLKTQNILGWHPKFNLTNALKLTHYSII